MPAVIVENDVSMWSDQTGVIYHFPKRYEKILASGTEVLYYKGRIRDKGFASARLSSSPHYFGKGRIGEVFVDTGSKKGDLYARIEGFTPFQFAVPAKVNGQYFEAIPLSKKANYWRDGVRQLTNENFDAILKSAVLLSSTLDITDAHFELQELESYVEGNKVSYYGTRYERDSKLRAKVIELHGLTCKACAFNFETAYGDYARGYIHVHHLIPISKFGGDKPVDPKTDMVTLCANCHAAIHRRRDVTLSLEQLIKTIKVRWVVKD